MQIVIAITFLAAVATAAPQHTITSHSANEIVLDSRGALMRRQDAKGKSSDVEKAEIREWKSNEELLAENIVGAKTHAKKAKDSDLYVMIGNNRCDGGGIWKHYELNAVTPGHYTFCSAACDSKDECLGFDVGNTGCNLYTQKAVALGTWPNVRFNNAEPFPGDGDHDAFAESPYDLELGTEPVAEGETYQCYRKTYFKPGDSYYWLIGQGTCSGGGGLWKRYTMTPGNFTTCENACNLRDECIGFDVGVWAVSDETEQVYQENFVTTLVSTTGCFMYTQKPVYGTWPQVQDITPQDGEGSHDKFPPTPNDLQVGYTARYQVGNHTKCYGKTHWVNLQQYYMRLGMQLCNGGGTWKHYKMAHGNVEDCKNKCDEQDVCVGVDFGPNGCRLYTRVAVPPGSWEGVEFGANGPFHGEGDHNNFPQTPYQLVPGNDAPDHGIHCYAKTHFETPDQVLGNADTR